MSECFRDESSGRPIARSAIGAPVSPLEERILGGAAQAFCAHRCAARIALVQSGLICPFQVIERVQGSVAVRDSDDKGLRVLTKVAENTWWHCVRGMLDGHDPLILLDAGKNN